MDSPDLTFEQVTSTGRTARVVMPSDDGSPYGKGVFREWLFEDGFVWLSYRDEERTYSVRLVPGYEVPQNGWHHVRGCDCRYCAAWREEAAGITRG